MSDILDTLKEGEGEGEKKPTLGKKMTSPWKSSDNPWTQDIFKLNKKRKGFHPRFASEDSMQKHLSSGYNIANGKDYGMGEGRVVRRGMVLLEMREEMAQSKKEYFEHLTQLRSSSNKEQLNKIKEDAKTQGVQISD